MRSFLGFVVFVVVLVAVAAAFLVPQIVAPVIATAVREASPFGDQPLDVKVDVDALSLIRGFVPAIHVSGTSLERDGATIESLDVTARTVGIGDHTFQETSGELNGLSVQADDGAVISVDRITLSGPSKALVAEATMGRAATLAFIQHAFEAQGVAVSGLELTAVGVSMVIFDQRVDVPVGVQDGALVIPDLLGAGPLELLAPRPDDPWRLTNATMSTNGLTIDAIVDVGKVLGSGEVGG